MVEVKCTYRVGREVYRPDATVDLLQPLRICLLKLHFTEQLATVMNLQVLERVLDRIHLWVLVLLPRVRPAAALQLELPYASETGFSKTARSRPSGTEAARWDVSKLFFCSVTATCKNICITACHDQAASFLTPC